MVLGDKAEDAFRQSMIMSRGSLSIFWSNGLVTTLMLIGLALALGPVLSTLVGRIVRPKASSAVA
jgi:TctA family transporter